MTLGNKSTVRRVGLRGARNVARCEGRGEMRGTGRGARDVAKCEKRGEVRGTWRGARFMARCEERGEVRETWRGGAAEPMKMTRFQAYGSRVYSAYISSRGTAASQNF